MRPASRLAVSSQCLPCLARLSRPCGERPQPCLRRVPQIFGTTVVFVFLGCHTFTTGLICFVFQWQSRCGINYPAIDEYQLDAFLRNVSRIFFFREADNVFGRFAPPSCLPTWWCTGQELAWARVVPTRAVKAEAFTFRMSRLASSISLFLVPRGKVYEQLLGFLKHLRSKTSSYL